jgi:hypothetical protein
MSVEESDAEVEVLAGKTWRPLRPNDDVFAFSMYRLRVIDAGDTPLPNETIVALLHELPWVVDRNSTKPLAGREQLSVVSIDPLDAEDFVCLGNGISLSTMDLARRYVRADGKPFGQRITVYADEDTYFHGTEE